MGPSATGHHALFLLLRHRRLVRIPTGSGNECAGRRSSGQFEQRGETLQVPVCWFRALAEWVEV